MLNYRVSSPSLRRLSIFATDEGFDIPYDGKLRLDAPNLEYFVLDEVMIECSVKRLALVNSVNLDLDVFLDADSDDDIVNGIYVGRCDSILKIVEAMESVRFLTLKGSITKALSYATVPFAACFKRLNKLDMRIYCCHWSSVGAVLGQSTDLRVLDITKTGCGKRTCKSSWNAPIEVPRCLSSSLNHVSFANFRGLEDEIAMVKYILQHGKVLESFILRSGTDPKLLQHISTFPRLSHGCHVHSD